MIRDNRLRALTASAVLAVSLALAGCYGDGGYELPTRAMKELSPQMLALLEQKNMPKESPILVRIFKEESELEVWKKDASDRFQLLKVYPICRWSGDLGPKVREGDRQAPEGFYQITPDLMNPNSSYYLAINTGFPNAYDKANGRTGGFLMIHGDCSSRGCYAMTDEQIGEIYSLARESFLGGQKSFQIQAYPFRMIPANFARHRTNPNLAFWKMIKVGNDHFEVTHLEPKVDVCERHYVFDAQPLAGSAKPLVFNPTGRCPKFEVPREIADSALEKQRDDDIQIAELTRQDVPVAPVRTGLDGGMNRVFLSQVAGIPPARTSTKMPPPDTTGAVAAENASPPSAPSRWLAGLFGSKAAAAPAQVASANTGSQERGGNLFGKLFSSSGESSQPASAAPGPHAVEPKMSGTSSAHKSKPAVSHADVAAVAASRPRTGSERSFPEAETTRATAKVREEANAGASPAGHTLLKGAQPLVSASSFDSRWGAMQ